MAGEESVRAFVSIGLDPSVEAALEPALSALYAEPIRGLRVVPRGNVHITLKFLGEVPSEMLPAAAEALGMAAACIRPFRLRLDAVGCFPGRRQPSVIWVGLAGDLDEAGRLHRAVAGAMKPFCESASDSEFLPHITLARLARGVSRVSRRRALDVASSMQPQPLSFEVGSVRMMRSRIGQQGARHYRLAEAELGAAVGMPRDRRSGGVASRGPVL